MGTDTILKVVKIILLILMAAAIYAGLEILPLYTEPEPILLPIWLKCLIYFCGGVFIGHQYHVLDK